MFPQILKNFNAFVDGRGYAGRTEELTLPKLTTKTEEFRAGGMDGSTELDMGLEKMEASLTLSEYSRDVLSLWGIIVGGAVSFVFRGAVQAQGQDAQPVVAAIRGKIKEFDPGNWKAGDKAVAKISIAVDYYKLTINGVDVIEIDVENMVRIVGGVDQTASLRAALGI